MKVKITHTVKSNEVPEKINNLIRPVRQQLEKSLQHFSSLEFLLSDTDTESISLSRMHLDMLRRVCISGHHAARGISMISGVDDYNMQEIAKQAMEEQLAKEEQEREQQLSQEFHGQECSRGCKK